MKYSSLIVATTLAAAIAFSGCTSASNSANTAYKARNSAAPAPNNAGHVMNNVNRAANKAANNIQHAVTSAMPSTTHKTNAAHKSAAVTSHTAKAKTTTARSAKTAKTAKTSKAVKPGKMVKKAAKTSGVKRNAGVNVAKAHTSAKAHKAVKTAKPAAKKAVTKANTAHKNTAAKAAAPRKTQTARAPRAGVNRAHNVNNRANRANRSFNVNRASNFGRNNRGMNSINPNMRYGGYRNAGTNNGMYQMNPAMNNAYGYNYGGYGFNRGTSGNPPRNQYSGNMNQYNNNMNQYYGMNQYPGNMSQASQFPNNTGAGNTNRFNINPAASNLLMTDRNAANPSSLSQTVNNANRGLIYSGLVYNPDARAYQRPYGTSTYYNVPSTNVVGASNIIPGTNTARVTSGTVNTSNFNRSGGGNTSANTASSVIRPTTAFGPAGYGNYTSPRTGYYGGVSEYNVDASSPASGYHTTYNMNENTPNKLTITIDTTPEKTGNTVSKAFATARPAAAPSTLSPGTGTRNNTTGPARTNRLHNTNRSNRTGTGTTNTGTGTTGTGAGTGASTTNNTTNTGVTLQRVS